MSWYLNALSLAFTALITLVPGLGYFLGRTPAVPETYPAVPAGPSGTQSPH